MVDSIRQNNRNPYFVTHLNTNPAMLATNDPECALKNADIAVLAIPSSYLQKTLQEFKSSLCRISGIVNVAKGFDLEQGRSLSQLICDELSLTPGQDRVAVLSGPNLAEEVSRQKLGASVIGCTNESLSATLQKAFSTPYFRVYRHSDRMGVELGGTLKNIFAIGAGISTGLELGDNAKAAYLTRSLAEMVRLGTKLGGIQSTFYGLSGLGDLMATSFSPLSRNHRLGRELARGTTWTNFSQGQRMVFEGVEAARMARDWGKKLTISLPISEEICKILFEDISSSEAARNLMTRSLKAEGE